MEKYVPGANGYAEARTRTATIKVLADANNVAHLGMGKNRIQVILGIGSATNFVWSVGAGSAAGDGIAQGASGGMIVLNRSLMGDSIDDDITVYTAAGMAAFFIVTTLMD